jgi:Spy/CpxP family protein refolding chaperone
VNTWKVILATMVIFGAGVVTGGLLVRHTAPPPHSPRPASPKAGPVSPSGLRMEVLRRVERELDLTPPQRAEVDRIISASQERTKKLMEPITPQLHAELQQTKDAVRAVLTPEQQPRFDELLKQQQQKPRDGKKSSGHSGDKPSGSAEPTKL